MKLRAALSALVLLFATAALASDASVAFDKLKTLEGSWAGKASDGQAVQVSYRITSGGSAIMSEIQGHENMISMFALDGDRLLITHYCAVGNQPRMAGTMSPDGKTFTFTFVDGTNILSSQPGHMQRVTFAIIDANHHTENWEFLTADGKQEHHELFDLQRQK